MTIKILPLALLSTILLLLLLALCAVFQTTAFLGSALTLLVVFYELTVPFEVIKFFKLGPKDFNIYAHHLESLLDIILPPFKMSIRPDWGKIKKELKSFLFTCLVVLLPYIIAYLIYFKWRAQTSSLDFFFSLNLPPQLTLEILLQVFVVALPEELFFRGFLQGAFLKHGLCLSLSAILANVLFAVSHLANSLSPARLLTFFPGLVFSYLIYKNKSLLSPILFHATCNILGQILYASVFLR